MRDYKALYDQHEENNALHLSIPETTAAEKELSDFLKRLDWDTASDLDTLAGKLARAWEMSGFRFALACMEAGAL